MDSLIPSLEDLTQMFHRASNRAMWLFFALPILLLLGIGLVAERSTASFAESEHWVSHTQEVRAVIENLRADMYVTQDSRKGYLLAGNGYGLENYTAAREQVPVLIKQLRNLTVDNPWQQATLDELEPIIQRKLLLAQESIDLIKSGSTDLLKQADLTRSNDALTRQMSSNLSQMVSEEDALLANRVVVSADTYKRMRLVLAIALAAVVVFLLVNFGRLLVELLNRTRAEAAVRRLSGRILQLQDMERRKIARELHDGIGQYFASSKMTLDSVLNGGTLSEAQKIALTEASQLLEQGVAEARTLSHLLHPPLLDEVGFRAAADWFIKGFSERSKIQVKFTAPADLGPMTKEVELVLFRVLQESLTNIHRHAGSTTAEVRLFSRGGK
jgi:signal transduction histidine kinase